MKKHIFTIFTLSSLVVSLNAATVPFDAYWNAVYRSEFSNASNYVDANDEAISDFSIEYADVKFDRSSIASSDGWASLPSPSVNKKATVNSITSTVSQEFYFQSAKVVVKNDYVATVSATDTPTFEDENNRKTLRFAVDVANDNFLEVGGDMILSTARVFNTKILYRKAGTASMSVGGQLKFNFTGGAAYGYHTFNIATGHADMAGIDLNLGGMASSNRSVAINTSSSTAPKGSINVNFNFRNDENGVFKGGSFEGSFTTSIANGSVANFSMSGDGKQSMTVYKAVTAGSKEKNNSTLLASQTDMTIGTVEVSNGEFIFNSELSIANVNLSGGTLSLTMGDGATVGNLTATGGSWIFADTIDVETFTSSGTINVVFTEALEKEFYTLITCNGLSVDPATTFVAVDKNGNQIAGNFDVVFADNKYLLNFTAVPEASEIAMLFGLIALGFVAYRRRK